MINILQRRIPIRLRLTLWYVLLMGITFTAFSIYLIFQFERSLRDSIDSSLEITATKTITELDQEDYAETGKFIFDHTGATEPLSDDFAMRIVSPRGDVWDVYSAFGQIHNWGKVGTEYSTQNGWRIHNRPILDSEGVLIGWVQAAQSLRPMEETMSDLREQLYFGIPVVLLLAGLGGYFLADRALRPVHQITRTAQNINGQDLSGRIDYRGAMDEVGRLAHTFDQMLARLQESFERERRFTSDAAHELRTPLTVLKGQIEVTLSRARGVDEYEAKLRELGKQVDRLIRLSNALLFLSRSDRRQIEFKPVSVNLTELLCVLIEQLHPLAEEKRLDISTQLTDDLFVRGDKDYLIRLFMNLLENALRYTPTEGQVQISAENIGVAPGRNDASVIRVTIHNSGDGLPAEHIPHLFERFYRVEASRSSQMGGTGLGLAIAHEIVELHGGLINVHSEPGKGVTISVHLPAAKDS